MAKKTQYFAGFRFTDSFIVEIKETMYQLNLTKTEFLTQALRKFIDSKKEEEDVKCPHCNSTNVIPFSSDYLCNDCKKYFPIP